MTTVKMTADELFEAAFGGSRSWEKSSQPAHHERVGIAELMQPHYPSTALAAWIAYEEGRAQRPVPLGTPFEWRTPQAVYPTNYDGVLIEHDEATNTNRITTRLGGMETVRVKRLDDIAVPTAPPIMPKPHRQAKAISLWEPWAILVPLGEKEWETRSWPPPADSVGCWVVIHAAKTEKDPETKERLELYVHREPFASVLRKHGYNGWADLPRGCAIGCARLVEYKRTEAMRDLSDQERAFGNYGPKRYAWHFVEPMLFPEPIPYKGHQNMWDWDLPLKEIAYEPAV